MGSLGDRLSAARLWELAEALEVVEVLLKHGADKGIATQPRYRYALNFAADRRYLYVMRQNYACDLPFVACRHDDWTYFSQVPMNVAV